VRFQKISYNKGRVKIEYEIRNTAKKDWDQFSLACLDEPKPEFQAHLMSLLSPEILLFLRSLILRRPPMVKVSQKFFEAVKLANRPAYKIAWEANLHPVILSKILHGYDRIWPNDRRVIAVAKVLGLNPDECFETESTDETDTSVE
jgi:hypothetical protein